MVFGDIVSKTHGRKEEAARSRALLFLLGAALCSCRGRISTVETGLELERTEMGGGGGGESTQAWGP